MTKDEFNNKRSNLGPGTHSCAIKLIGYDLIKKERQSYKTFQSLIPALKELREKSDYENVGISQSEGHTALTYSDSIKNILTKIYK